MKTISFVMLLFVCHLAISKTDTIEYIKNFKITPDYSFKGAQGIYIEYTVDFNQLRKEINNDSILSMTKFYFNTTLSINGTKIKPALGYNYMKNSNGNYQYIKKYDDFEFDNSSAIKESYFIPYSAIGVDSGVNKINILSSLSGTDGYGKEYLQNLIYKDILIHKPKQNKVVFNIDYVEVETLNTKKQSWDYNIYNNDKPDVSVSFYIGNTLIWTDNVKDSYIYAKGPKSKNITFNVSENDKIRLRVEDIDVVFNDYIAELIIPTPKITTAKSFVVSNKFGSVKDCAITWKIE